MSLKKTGTITFWCKHRHKDWFSNGKGYKFPTVSSGPITAWAAKHPDVTFEATIDGPFGHIFSFRVPVPKCEPKGLFVAIAWENSKVKLYLNGEMKAQKSVDQADTSDESEPM